MRRTLRPCSLEVAPPWHHCHLSAARKKGRTRVEEIGEEESHDGAPVFQSVDTVSAEARNKPDAWYHVPVRLISPILKTKRRIYHQLNRTEGLSEVCRGQAQTRIIAVSVGCLDHAAFIPLNFPGL